MTYQTYCGLSREALLGKIAAQMSEKRFQHVLGVEKAAIDLAKANAYDPDKAGLTALLHDYAKEVSDAEFLSLIDKYELDADLKKWGNNIWHGIVGIYKIKEDLGLSDPDILQAIARHTVGAAEMTTLDKIVYVADYIEYNRKFPGVEEAREIAKVSLNQAVAYETAHTVEHLAHQGLPIHPQTIDTYNAYVRYLRD